MVYTEKDIDFSKISSLEFENLCYDMVVYNGFQNVIWRQGGADSGRDIEAKYPFNTAFSQGHFTKWFFECKHYANGVPVADLSSKLDWADAEGPDFLVIFTTSYITNSAKQWLEKMQAKKHYKIIIVEGEQIKTKLTEIQHLIPKYFSSDKYIKLYQDIRRHRLLYSINPSIQVLSDIISSISVERFELDDLSFLINACYVNYVKDEIDSDTKWEEYSHWYKNFSYPLFERLKKISTQTDLSQFFNDYDFLESYGFISDAKDYTYTSRNYQHCVLHLNYSNREKWETGSYTLVIINKEEAFELFAKKDEIYTYYHSSYNENLLNSILSKFCDKKEIEKVKEYAKAI